MSGSALSARRTPFTRPSQARSPLRSESVQSKLRHLPRHVPSAQAANNEGFGAMIARIGKKIQGGLPIVGLISRLASPEGGFDDVSYPEFCRAWLNQNSKELAGPIHELQGRHGRQASRKIILFIAWLSQRGCALLPDRYVVLTGRRLHASLDIEAEMNRFDQNLEVELKKYELMTAPKPTLIQQVTVCVDALSTCCFGLKDHEAVEDEDVLALAKLITVLFDGIAQDELLEIINSKASRKYD